MCIYDGQDFFQRDRGHATIVAKTRFRLAVRMAEMLVGQHSRGVGQWLPANEFGGAKQGDHRCPGTGCQMHRPTVVANIEMALLDQPGQLVEVKLIMGIGQWLIGKLANVVDGLAFTCACSEEYHLKISCVKRFTQRGEF